MKHLLNYLEELDVVDLSREELENSCHLIDHLNNKNPSLEQRLLLLYLKVRFEKQILQFDREAVLDGLELLPRPRII